ncbi:unnamed protein product, partial [Ectocarpus sp. 12 AP-2014]
SPSRSSSSTSASLPTPALAGRWPRSRSEIVHARLACKREEKREDLYKRYSNESRSCTQECRVFADPSRLHGGGEVGKESVKSTGATGYLLWR